MKVFNPKGSKERFFELTEKVNKIKINEDFGSIQEKNKRRIEMALAKLKDGSLERRKGGSNRTTVQTTADEMFVTIKGVDKDGNKFDYEFVVVGEEGLEDDIFVVDQIKLKELGYRSFNSEEVFLLDDRDLEFFNKEDNTHLYTTITRYLDVDLAEERPEAEEDEEGEVETPEAVADEEEGDVDLNEAVEQKNIVFKHKDGRTVEKDVTNYDTYRINDLMKTYHKQNPDVETFYFDIKEKKINEATKDDKYEDVVFLQGSEADEALEILDNRGVDAALNYLKQWHDPGNHMGSDELGHGTADYTYEKDGNHMSWNPYIGYIGLQYDLSYLDENVEVNGEMKKVVPGYQLKDVDENVDVDNTGNVVEYSAFERLKELYGEMEGLRDNFVTIPEYETIMELMKSILSKNYDEMKDDDENDFVDIVLGFKPLNVGDV